MLVKGARLYFLITMGTLLLLNVPMHPLPVIVKTTCKLESDPALVTNDWFILAAFGLFLCLLSHPETLLFIEII